MSLLIVEGLSMEYDTRYGPLRALNGVTFSLARGEALGLVGESGCGKTTLVKSILRLLPSNGRMTAGRVLFDGQDLVRLPESELRKVRLDRIALVTQSAMNALDPVYRVGDQIAEGILAKRKVSRREAWARAEELFRLVGLEAKRLTAYPHQLSGGMKQRTVIAIALSLDPQVIIADEPTTALDVILQDRILRQMRQLHAVRGDSMIYVSHDISVIAETCDRVGVMYAGEIVELTDVRSFFQEPYHPYTMGLQNAFPSILEGSKELVSLPGYPPGLLEPRVGCPFADRCPFVQDVCLIERPPLREVGAGHFAACHFPEQAEAFRAAARTPDVWLQVQERQSGRKVAGRVSVKVALSGTGSRRDRGPSEDPETRGVGRNQDVLYELIDLHKSFHLGSDLLAHLSRSGKRWLKAVDGVSLYIHKGEILGLAGESGCGKSTLGELLASLQEPSAGRILFEGKDLAQLKGDALTTFRRSVQMIFQDPYESLSPRFSVYDAVVEPLRIHGLGNAREQYERVVRVLEEVELRPATDFLDRFPHELSGGQRQRVAIARAVILRPKFVVADEPVSMLDVSVRAGILNLLRRLREELGLTMLYVSHDLSTVKYLAQRMATMYLGRIVEVAPTAVMPQGALHPYTKALFAAVPVADPTRTRAPVPIRGELALLDDRSPGCPFAPRCPHAMDMCNSIPPVLRLYGDDHYVSCHLYHDRDGTPYEVPLQGTSGEIM